MFKKKNIDKTIDINKDIETIETNQQDKNSTQQKNKSNNNEQQRQLKPEQQRPLMRYGLIQKQPPKLPQKPKQQNILVKMYIKKRMEQIQAKQKYQPDTTATEILQMQKQYLSAAQSKITEYDVKQIHKKIQKVATESIKSQLQNRKLYLIELLQSDHQKMQYASKKQLKLIKQDRQRLQKQLSSKYKSEGRRHFVEYIKQTNISGNS